ncbi:hypothetical protein VAWG006_08430 [Aeromonas enteropelogenes]|uniref:Uncharacterized protein n=1 Tax=Aeromonas sp. 19NY04SH05-1 TaxID=2920537 RepID=A0AAU6TAX9_9GAMM|nr:hypothetical protein [Aeromonas enteropelogenes]MBL0520500.1 hypothetical protein [Aeromonas enteropelogenes]UBH50614.1 hypothetical protein LA321_11040 [Aeromonas enteropelogenes]BEE16590.1 hypothetical protein VAWG006_08430 [Aeromonas enteropelogenes]BEE20753.1 hypothetical protein VAWG007_08480 [Aeromonas enteropelogenes]
MRSIFSVIFLFFSFSVQAACEKVSFDEIKKSYDNVFYDVSNIIVTSKGRVFFHDFPIDKCKSKKFIINGDKAISYASYNGFQYINYLDRNGEVHTGWIESSRVSKKETSSEYLNIKKNDFSIHFNGHDIKVGASYSEIVGVFDDFSETTDDGNGFLDVFKTINGVDYKFYPHDFDFIYIESSNLNYEKLKRDFDDYRITKIILKKSIGFSSRGIYVGSKMLDVVKVYGVPASKKDGAFIYVSDNYTIKFVGSEVVNEIEVSINPI